MTFKIIHLNNDDPKALSIIDYINNMNVPFYVDQLDLSKILDLNIGLKCGSSISLLPIAMQNYFSQTDRSAQVIAQANLQVEKVTEFIVNYFKESLKKEVQVSYNFGLHNNIRTIISSKIKLLEGKNESKKSIYRT